MMMNICIIGQTALQLLDDNGWQSANTYIVTHADIHFTSYSPGVLLYLTVLFACRQQEERQRIVAEKQKRQQERAKLDEETRSREVGCRYCLSYSDQFVMLTIISWYWPEVRLSLSKAVSVKQSDVTIVMMIVHAQVRELCHHRHHEAMIH